MQLRRLPVAGAIAAASGAFTALGREPFGIWPIVFFSLAPLLWLLRDARPRRGAFLGLCFGLTYHGIVFSWILLFGKPAWLGLTLALSAYTALYGLLAPLIWRAHAPIRSSFGLAALWVAMEYTRGHWPLGGLTWTDLVYTQASDRTLLPLAMITGGLGITFVIVLINALLSGLSRGSSTRTRLAIVASCLALVLGPSLISAPQPNGPSVDVAALQVQLPPASTDRAANRAMAESFIRLHRTLAETPPDLVVWPENALDEDPSQQPNAGGFLEEIITGNAAAGEGSGSLRSLVVEAIRDTGAPTLVGTITGAVSGVQYNQVVLYRPDGSVADRYAKVHLVPYGEFAPARGFLSTFVREITMVRRDLTPGAVIHPIRTAGLPTFGSVICFENAFSQIDRLLVHDGAEFLVVASNNSSYLRTPASSQHLAISQIRAVELQRWVVHAGLTGPSAFIDPSGRVSQRTDLFTDTIIRGQITASTARTPYVQFGDWLPWASVAFVLFAFVAPRRRRRARVGEPLVGAFRTLVVLPTYNEAATIAEVLTRLLETSEDLDMVVVDDGSPDGTGDIVERIAAGGAPVRLIRRAAKAGLASAYVTGFDLGLREGYDVIVEMDSDLSHQPEELSALLQGVRLGADLAIGSRYVRGGSVTNWSRARVALSRTGNRYARTCLGVGIKDITSGFRAYRRGVLEELMQSEIHADGYGFQVELAWRALRGGYDVVEVPITFREREHGHSKISRRIVVEALWLVTIWGLRDRLRPAEPADDAQGLGEPWPKQPALDRGSS